MFMKIRNILGFYKGSHVCLAQTTRSYESLDQGDGYCMDQTLTSSYDSRFSCELAGIKTDITVDRLVRERGRHCECY